LKSSYSLRTQLLLSFGISAGFFMVLVVICALITALGAGRTVKNHSELLMRRQVTDNLLHSSRLLAEKFEAFMNNVEGTVQLMVEVTQDRIAGYPLPNWEDDRFVPFVDRFSQTGAYPIHMPPAPLEWNLTVNLNASNAVEHLQERASWIAMFPNCTTGSASFFFQGTCDPTVTDPTSARYYPQCTNANNNVTTGGVVQPTATLAGLYQKSGDLSVFLKSLYESHPRALLLGVYFVNSGAGAYLQWPGGPNQAANNASYTSIGCDWLRMQNPYTNVSMATEQEIARCHPAGTVVRNREYNPLERAYIRYAIMNYGQVVWYGPYALNDNGIALMFVGKAVFDRM
jgi:hypothetical protein